MPRPIILGVVGDSAAGKTTITRGLVRILGAEKVTHVCTDDYHRYDRKQRAELDITPLDPECNYIDVMAQHLRHLRNGEPILKPVYNHHDGTFGPPVYVAPSAFTVVEGLLGYHTSHMRECYDVRVYLAPPEELRRKWKVARDTSRRGYTTDKVLTELDRREPDSAAYIRPQEQDADIVISFTPAAGDGGSDVLDAELVLRAGLPHPDLSPFEGNGAKGIQVDDRESECHVCIPGDIEPDRAGEIEEAIWERLHFATHLRSQRLGEYTVGNDLHRSESLALVQLLILYQLATAKAAIALGGESARTGERQTPDNSPQQHEEEQQEKDEHLREGEAEAEKAAEDEDAKEAAKA
ncbi:MAG TPA: phosphoribulokinase [Thermoleophilaceae bacterium]|nr:phosphoribulokinase [Thermoleophilaceae bacterium]